MSLPEIESGEGVYVLRWFDEGIMARVDRIIDRSESTSGEVYFKQTRAQPEHLYRGRLNFLSPLTRARWQAILEKRLELNWYEILEQLCNKVLDAHRRGEPSIRLGDLPPREALQWRVQPLLVENQANLIYGAGQSGKSLLAVYLAILIESPLNHNGLVVEPGKVLYLDYEADKDEVGERARMIQRGLGIETTTDIRYRFGKAPLHNEIEEVAKEVLEHEIDLVIVDSFGMAAGGDQDKNEAVIQYFQALRSLKRTTLTIDHLNKEGKLYGNIYKFNAARCVYEAKAVSHPGAKSLDIGLYHRKMNSGMLQPPLGYSASFSGGMCVFCEQNITDVDELADAVPLRIRITELLRRGSLSVRDIADALDKTSDTVRKVLHRHKASFQIVYQEGSREPFWGLKSTVSLDTGQ